MALDNFVVNTMQPASGNGTLGIEEAGSATYSGAITVNNGGTLTAANGGTANFSGVLSGAGGITKTGVGTIVADGKEVREFDGDHYVMERSLVADVSLVKAWRADPTGNLIFRKTARNFNPNVAMAGKITIVEVEEMVATGELDPDSIHTPGIFVHRIIVNATPEKRIEQRTISAK